MSPHCWTSQQWHPALAVVLLITLSVGCRPPAPSDAPTAAPADAAPSEKQRVAAIRAGEANDSDALIEVVRRVDELGGRIDFDSQGRLIGVDLTPQRMQATNDDVALLARLPHLTALHVLGGEIDSRAIQSLMGVTQLTALSLRGTQIDDDALAQLDGLARLESLDIRASLNLTDAALTSVARHTELTHLHLLDNNFTDDGLAALAPLARLKLIDLRGCGQISDAGLRHVRRLASLENVKLRGYTITDAGVASLAELPKLRGVEIENSGITGDCLQALAQRPLEELTLFRCFSLTPENLAGLERFTSLRRLSLRDTSTDAAVLAHVAKLTQLEQLNLTETMVDDEAVAHLSLLANLRRLHVRQTQITDAALRTFATLPNLDYLDLQDNQITDAGLEHLQGATQLRTLVLTANFGVSQQAVDKLAKSLPDCRIER